jgi:hypothetical protein
VKRLHSHFPRSGYSCTNSAAADQQKLKITFSSMKRVAYILSHGYDCFEKQVAFCYKSLFLDVFPLVGLLF